MRTQQIKLKHLLCMGTPISSRTYCRGQLQSGKSSMMIWTRSWQGGFNLSPYLEEWSGWGQSLIDKDGMPAIVEILRKRVVLSKAHQNFWNHAWTFWQVQQPIDLLTVHEALNKGGKLEEIGGGDTPSNWVIRLVLAANIEFHAGIIAQKFIQRELIRYLQYLQFVWGYHDVSGNPGWGRAGAVPTLLDQNPQPGYESLFTLVVQARKK